MRDRNNIVIEIGDTVVTCSGNGRSGAKLIVGKVTNVGDSFITVDDGHKHTIRYSNNIQLMIKSYYSNIYLE